MKSLVGGVEYREVTEVFGGLIKIYIIVDIISRIKVIEIIVVGKKVLLTCFKYGNERIRVVV